MEPAACLRGMVIDAPVYLGAATAAGLVVLAVWILRHEDFFGRRHFVATVIGMILWLSLAAAEMATPALACKMAVAAATWTAIALVPTAWTLFLWHFCFGVPALRYRREVAAMGLLAAVVAGAALSNPWHGLFYGPGTVLVDTGGRPHASFDHGPLFHGVAAVLYLVLAAGLVLAATAAFRAARPLRPLMLMLMFATAVPMAANLAYVVFDASLFGFDTTPFAFSFVLLALTGAIYANRGLDLVSVARELLYFNLADPVLVVNAEGAVVGANAAARALMRGAEAGGAAGDGPAADMIRRAVAGAAGSPGATDPEGELALAGRRFALRVLPIPRPLHAAGAPLGAVAILSDVTELRRRNDQLAAALDRSRRQIAEITRLREIAEQSAMSDPLTGLGNLRGLTARVAALGAAPLALALVDLDHFKQINDRLGHAVGDRVLRDFAAAARAVLGAEAEVFRIGGEEFVVLLPGRPLCDLLALMARLRRRLAEVPLLRGQDGWRVTFSAGVAASPQDGTGLAALQASADARLYLAKRNGRDRVMHLDCVASAAPGPVIGRTGSTHD